MKLTEENMILIGVIAIAFCIAVFGMYGLINSAAEPAQKVYPYYTAGDLVMDNTYNVFAVIDGYNAGEDTYTYHDVEVDLHAGNITSEMPEKKISTRNDIQKYFPVCVTLHK